ncbi:hypothetical protein [Actinomadura terrae]|uniref:hypothetical protein n=1 Tax=Actinomadura terrae TaxID=604353 RepID=UPI001FA7BC91|nr:hypothetical protein [Actinomadura terrae]
MSDTSSRPAGPEDFIAELNAFYESCNRPPYRKLAEISEHLGELYGRRGLPVLSATAVFEVLAGRRKRAPTSAWVASFILCCQRRAWETGVRSSDPGISTLPHWQSRLRAAQSAPAERAAERAEGAAPQPRNSPEARSPVPLRLTASQQVTIADYKEHGRELLDRAQGGDADAVYRIAVLLGTDPTRGAEAIALLIDAAAGGHPQALDLLDASPNGLDPRQAAEHAHRLGESAPTREAALAYYQAAVGGGRFEAAFKITEILQEAGDGPRR